MKRPTASSFFAIPDDPELRLTWPTGNTNLFKDPARFFAVTRANAAYGMPGWTRDCGNKFHRGADIAPVNPLPTGQFTTVMFSDCEAGKEYESEEPTWAVDEEIFTVAAGVVEEINTIPDATTLGCYIMIRHRWPASGSSFFTLYAHLAKIEVQVGEPVNSGQTIGRMGQTSSSPDARNWMAIAPHLHFEVLDASLESYHPVDFLTRYLR